MSTLIIIILLVLCIGLTALSGVLLVFYRDLNRHLDVVMQLTHNGCVRRVKNVVSTTHDATLLRAMAERYDSVENQHNLAVLRRTSIPNSEVTIPAQWLLRQADKLDPPRNAEEAIYTLAGERLA